MLHGLPPANKLPGDSETLEMVRCRSACSRDSYFNVRTNNSGMSSMRLPKGKRKENVRARRKCGRAGSRRLRIVAVFAFHLLAPEYVKEKGHRAGENRYLVIPEMI